MLLSSKDHNHKSVTQTSKQPNKEYIVENVMPDEVGVMRCTMQRIRYRVQ